MEFLAPFGGCTKVLLVGLRGLSASHTLHTPELPIPLARPCSAQEICSFQQGKGEKGMSWPLHPPAQLGQAAMSCVGWEWLGNAMD